MFTDFHADRPADYDWYTGTQLDHASSGSWIDRLNGYRVMAGLSPVRENPRLSAADRAHARYLVRNFDDGVTQGGAAHGETRGNPWYTVDGDGAGRRGDIALRKVIVESPLDGVPDAIGAAAIDEWIAGPFHRFDLLDPAVTSAGWGSVREGDVSASVLEVQRSQFALRRGRMRAVMFPPPGSSISIGAFPGGEWPNPLAACPGYSTPSGLPISIQFGPHTSLRVGSHWMTADGDAVEHCVYDPASYSAGGEADQPAAAMSALRNAGAIVIVPRAPMSAGHLYEVSIDVNGRNYQWSFRIAAPNAPSGTLHAQAAQSDY